MQAYFARILAGEIKQPGSFSPATLDVAAKLTTELAVLFQQFCDATSSTTTLGTKLVASPFGGQPGNNELASLGLNCDNLALLQDAMLIQTDLSTYQLVPPLEAFGGSSFELAGVAFQAPPENPEELPQGAKVNAKIVSINFTRAGLELRGIVHMTPHPLMVEKLGAYLKLFGLSLKRL
jgi:hypothetical protein